jgi:phage portal protein BeeE
MSNINQMPTDLNTLLNQNFSLNEIALEIGVDPRTLRQVSQGFANTLLPSTKHRVASGLVKLVKDPSPLRDKNSRRLFVRSNRSKTHV